MPPKTMTTREACVLLKVTPSAVSKMVKRGELEPRYQLPGTRGAFLFDRDEIERMASEAAR